jgi:hypothetical protein
MMYAVHQEMQREEQRPIRQHFINMEQKAMESILQHRPNDVPNEKAHHRLGDGL